MLVSLVWSTPIKCCHFATNRPIRIISSVVTDVYCLYCSGVIRQNGSWFIGSRYGFIKYAGPVLIWFICTCITPIVWTETTVTSQAGETLSTMRITLQRLLSVLSRPYVTNQTRRNQVSLHIYSERLPVQLTLFVCPRTYAEESTSDKL